MKTTITAEQRLEMKMNSAFISRFYEIMDDHCITQLMENDMEIGLYHMWKAWDQKTADEMKKRLF